MKKAFFICLIVWFSICWSVESADFLKIFHNISSNEIIKDIEELSSPGYAGRLGGSDGNRRALDYILLRLKDCGLKPVLADGSYFQKFSNPYVEILPGSKFELLIAEKKGVIRKEYQIGTDFHPGGCSDSGELQAEVVYVGYGISAPELGYDDYQGVDVRGKFVLVEPEVPVAPENSELFLKWRPYSFHHYKVENALKHQAAGIIFNYDIINPNTTWKRNFLQLNISQKVMQDLFCGKFENPQMVKERIKNSLKPFSFSTGKKIYFKVDTIYHPQGEGRNLLLRLGDKDKPAIILAAHHDGQGKDSYHYPSANDNASGVAVLIAVARALSCVEQELPYSVIFAFFDAEEQGVKGSEFFVNNIPLPEEKILFCINLDGVGRGEKITALAAKNFPEIWAPFAAVNDAYIHRQIDELLFANIARPRLDAAHFLWKNIKTVSLSADGMPRLPYSTYHKYSDTVENLTPEIIEDVARLIFATLISQADHFVKK